MTIMIIKKFILSVMVPIVVTLITARFELFKQSSIERGKLRGKNGKSKYDELNRLREIIQELDIYEDLSVTEPREDLIEENRSNSVLTPAICYTYKNMVEYNQKLNNAMGKNAAYINDKIYIKIVLLRNFLFEYARVCRDNSLDDKMIRWISTPLQKSFSDFGRKIQLLLINEINKTNLSLYSHQGKFYRHKLKREDKLARKKEFFYLYIDKDTGDFYKLLDCSSNENL